jgi:hypothetical protein
MTNVTRRFLREVFEARGGYGVSVIRFLEIPGKKVPNRSTLQRPPRATGRVRSRRTWLPPCARAGTTGGLPSAPRASSTEAARPRPPWASSARARSRTKEVRGSFSRSVQHTHSRHRHISCGARHGMPGRRRRDALRREARNDPATGAIERRSDVANIPRVRGPFSLTFDPPLFPNRSHGRRV